MPLGGITLISAGQSKTSAEENYLHSYTPVPSITKETKSRREKIRGSTRESCKEFETETQPQPQPRLPSWLSCGECG
ncbi:hypothetical protein AAHA92_00364 [Salvia divinorum]|uniref:Uncharacterized protein n=1 Tax=Salvia divinorum TaxID=28513 RepID=A0ABD1IKD3_SALDI